MYLIQIFYRITTGLTFNNSFQAGILLAAATSNLNHCTGKDTILVNSKECLIGLYVPNAFTPNGDGINDLFRPILGGNVKQYKFSIFNRWGELIFQTFDSYKGWDGIFKSHLQNNRVFVWQCNYQLEGEKPKLEKGIVVVIK